MLLIVFPLTVVKAATIGLYHSSSSILLIVLPVPVIDRTVLIVKTTHSFKVPVMKMPFVSADSHEKHESLAFKVAI